MLAAKLVSLLAFGGDALVVCGVHVLGVSNLGAEVVSGKDESAWQRVIIIWIPGNGQWVSAMPWVTEMLSSLRTMRCPTLYSLNPRIIPNRKIPFSVLASEAATAARRARGRIDQVYP